MTAPFNANTSGLEVSLAAVLARAICESEGKDWAALDNTREDVERWFRLGEVTAASAQARIAELESALAAAQNADAENDAHLRCRATAAEARADRLAKALEPFVRHGRACGAFGEDAGPFWIMTDSGHRDVPVDDFRVARAALQQETQP